MNRLFGICIIFGVLAAQGAAAGQDTRIVIRAVDGRNGKPLGSQRLLVFAGGSPEVAKQHNNEFELSTDKDGVATITGMPGTVRWIQVWMDWHILCQSDPNNKSFSVAEILARGLSTPNSCGSVAQDSKPGELVVFARPAHWWEKMKF